MVLIKHGGDPIAVACALHRNANWVELAWVAVAPAHRGQGFGRIVCAAVVSRVLALSQYQLYGSTQDARLTALKIYLEIGFHPVYRPEKVGRWQSVCHQLGVPFAPTLWGWQSTSKNPVF